MGMQWDGRQPPWAFLKIPSSSSGADSNSPRVLSLACPTRPDPVTPPDAGLCHSYSIRRESGSEWRGRADSRGTWVRLDPEGWRAEEADCSLRAGQQALKVDKGERRTPWSHPHTIHHPRGGHGTGQGRIKISAAPCCCFSLVADAIRPEHNPPTEYDQRACPMSLPPPAPGPTKCCTGRPRDEWLRRSNLAACP